MAGVPHGIHSIVSEYATSIVATRANFCRIIAALDHAGTFGYCTRISSYFGLGGTGFGMPGSGTEPGPWAFAVYRWNANAGRTWEWYLLVQWGAGGSVPAGEPVDPTYAADPFVGVQAAVAFDQLGAPASPWKGTILNNGADAKANPVWGKLTGHVDERVYVWTRSNDTGGVYATVKQRLSNLDLESYPRFTMRMHVVVDADGLVLTHDVRDDAQRQRFLVIAPYVPVSGLNPSCPLFMVATSNTTKYLALNSTIGPTTLSAILEGGAYSPRADQVTSCVVQVRDPDYSENSVRAYQPNSQFSSKVVTASRLALYASEAPTQGFLGFVDDIVMFANGVIRGSTLQSKQYAALIESYSSGSVGKLLMKWDGVTADPLAGNSPLGVTF